jgi:gliding motility-associated-like protein
MKKLFFSFIVSLFTSAAFANHITGGEMYYTLTGQSGNNYTYHVVLKLYRDCNAPPDAADLDPAAAIGIFNNSTFALAWSRSITMTKRTKLSLDNPNPCINRPPIVCYDVGYYEFDVTLPGVAQGYTIAYQRYSRINGINNLLSPSNTVGATYTAQIPGNSVRPDGPANNSARFVGEDRVIVCANNAFTYDFGASDSDSTDPNKADSLVYSFCNAYTGGSANAAAPNPPAAPPYTSVPYKPPYNESSPLGNRVTINPRTGLVTGIAPAVGIYVVTVCVTEYRKGVAIAIQRKDLQIKVGDCSMATPALDPQYITCDGYNLTFSNHNNNPLIRTYEWSFGDGNLSTDRIPTHTYTDTGIYNIKLVVNRGEPCSDSATALAKVYPGFFPDFTFAGICVNKTTQFFDASSTAYGVIDSWKWDFGDLSSVTDVSTSQNPSYTYPQTGVKKVQFTVTSNKGCIDTIYKDVTIFDKPPLQVLPKDTLICNGDNVQLRAVGNGTFSWTPNTNIINANTATPTVSPATTTNYIVSLDDNGCVNTDTVRIRVVDFVTLRAMPDTVICATDSVQLGAVTDGLRFTWTPSANMNDPTLLRPTVLPAATTTYQITAAIGHCTAMDVVTVTLVPYPGANAGPDTTVCFDTKAQLHASINGSSFTWSPSSSLDNPNSLNPVASPRSTTKYVLTVRDNIGCPKPSRDTVVVNVLPKINAFAGRDTAVVAGQRLQFNASGGVGYFWTPSTALSRNDIKNPFGIYDGSFDNIRYKLIVTNEVGCIDSAYVTIKVFKTMPRVFVPTAFTPNGDGKNDYLRPVAVGISKFDYFRIYNRWGQLVYSSTDTEGGWDGRIGGKEQNTATFVWMVKATDFTGKVFIDKGTVTLIR